MRRERHAAQTAPHHHRRIHTSPPRHGRPARLTHLRRRRPHSHLARHHRPHHHWRNKTRAQPRLERLNLRQQPHHQPPAQRAHPQPRDIPEHRHQQRAQQTGNRRRKGSAGLGGVGGNGGHAACSSAVNDHRKMPYPPRRAKELLRYNPTIIRHSARDYIFFPAVQPPSTASVVPVMKLFSSAARNRIALATSAGSAQRPTACMSRMVCVIASSWK